MSLRPQIVRLGDIAKVKGGKRLPKGTPLSNGPTPHPYIRVSDMKNGSVDESAIKYIDKDTYRRIARYTISSNDLYITIAGTLGQVGTVPQSLSGANLTENAAKIVLNDADHVVRDYLAALFNGGLGERLVARQKGVGGGVPKLALFRIENAQIPILPRPLMLAAVAAYRAFGDVANNLGRMIDAKRTFKRGLMQQLLTGQKRLPEFRDRPWKLHRFDHLCEEVSDRNGKRFGADSVMGVIKGAGFEPMRDRVRGKGDLCRYKVVPPGAFAYNPMRLNIGSIAYNTLGRPILVSPDYEVFRAIKGEARSDFVNQLRHSGYWSSFMKRAGAGSVRVRIYFTDLARLRVPKPDVDEQERIALTLNLLDSERDLIAAQRDQIEMLKRFLLSRLLSGDLQVPA